MHVQFWVFSLPKKVSNRMIQLEISTAQGGNPPNWRVPVAGEKRCAETETSRILKSVRLPQFGWIDPWSENWNWRGQCFVERSIQMETKKGTWYAGKQVSLIFWVVVSKSFMFIPIWEDEPILTNMFQMGWNHQLVTYWNVNLFWWFDP